MIGRCAGSTRRDRLPNRIRGRHVVPHHGLALDTGGSGLAALLLAMLMAGLGGGLTHCVGMCGPFVMAQVTSALDRDGASGYGMLQRLSGAALVPYHLGRTTTYVGLGALSASVVGFVGNLAGLRVIAAFLLALAAIAMVAQALGRGLPALGRLSGRAGAALVPAIARPLLARPTGWRGYALGVALGFLPCGILYAALAAAAGSQDPLRGALMMAAFALGTAPGLVGVGWAGLLFGRRWARITAIATPLLLLASAALLLAMAWRLVA
ncbi:MAG: sulfite exporter TauE/SafE family protein [Alphaproteobacteria bacterium]|nr:sulfite exporter TauE/SafE family protein [Alphaproteobacteria bacterium]